MTRGATSSRVVSALVGAGLLDGSRREDAERVVATTLEVGVSDEPGPLRRRLAEIAGYVGGAFVLGAALLFLGSTWTDLALTGQVALLVGSAMLLSGAGTAVLVSAGGRNALLGQGEEGRRRLTSMLLTGAAACLSFALGLLLAHRMANQELAVMLAFLGGAASAVAGYRAAPSAVGQLGTAFAVAMLVPTGLGALHPDTSGLLVAGLLLLAVGVLWLVTTDLGWWREPMSGRVIGCVLVLLGAQLPVADSGSWVGYLATTAVGALAFWRYAVGRAWPYLATGVVALTLAVPEALDDWFAGSLGAAGILLVTGVTLLVAALLGLRLRQAADDDGVAPRGA